MTYREKLQQEQPDKVSSIYIGGCSGCPGCYWEGADLLRSGCSNKSCFACWNQEVGAAGRPTTQEDPKKVVYIAGPITGVAKYWEAFEAAEEDLLAKGYIPLSPSRLPEGMTRAQYARIDMASIDAADVVLMLPGWPASSGASLELAYANYINKPVAFNMAELEEVLGE